MHVLEKYETIRTLVEIRDPFCNSLVLVRHVVVFGALHLPERRLVDRAWVRVAHSVSVNGDKFVNSTLVT